VIETIRDDFLFGLVAAALFALAAVLLFGAAVTDASFWRQLLPTLGVVVVASFMRAPLRSLTNAPRFVAWFGLGFTATAFIAFAGEHQFDLLTASAFGGLLGLLEFAADRFGREEEVTNG
tara:strand:- start:215949 stop:216308 length:360 start_codon:yes stop_codon:yes gene_type:complete